MSTSVDIEDLKQELGEKIYEVVMDRFPDDDDKLWGKITGMLIESIELSVLREIVSDISKLNETIQEAYEFYLTHVNKITPSKQEQEQYNMVPIKKLSRSEITSRLTPDQKVLFDFVVRFSGEKVKGEKSSDEDIVYVCDDMKVFETYSKLLYKAKFSYPLPIKFLGFVFEQNHLLHTLKEYQVPKYNNARVFYIRLIIYFISSIKFCLINGVRFDMEKYMRSAVFVDEQSVLSGPFLYIWTNKIMAPYRRYLYSLHHDVEEYERLRDVKFAKKAAYDFMYPSLDGSSDKCDKTGGFGCKRGKKDF